MAKRLFPVLLERWNDDDDDAPAIMLFIAPNWTEAVELCLAIFSNRGWVLSDKNDGEGLYGFGGSTRFIGRVGAGSWSWSP